MIESKIPPPVETCGACKWFKRCKALIHDLPADGPCDFIPSRFVPAPEVKS